ncbi:MAG TPA: hypothetical protein VGP07_02130 [Polyangia bacterium]|jgi:hypothetical protein
MKTKQNTTKKVATPDRSQVVRGRAVRGETVRKVAPRPAWQGDEVEDKNARGGHASEPAEQAATRAEGNAPIAASDIEKYLAGGDIGETRTPRKGDAAADELKRQAAAEEHVAARDGKLVRGPI